MLARIIMFVSFLMCAIPFLIISKYSKDSMTPIPFWSGSENKLKKQLRDIEQYNCKMTSLYRYCAIAFLLTGFASCVHPVVGLIMFGCDCTIGVFFVYQKYKNILNQYS